MVRRQNWFGRLARVELKAFFPKAEAEPLRTAIGAKGRNSKVLAQNPALKNVLHPLYKRLVGGAGEWAERTSYLDF